MYDIIKNFIYLLGCIRLIPHIIYYVLFDNSAFADDLFVSSGDNGLWTFIVWIQKKKYMRNLFYLRAGKWFRLFFEFFLPIDDSLHLYNFPLGKRCHLEHSQCSFINARSIGHDFYCLHNVTIGNKLSKGSNPSLGNNVRVFTGAVIIGNIKIGDNVIVAANSVVNKDVPSNCVVAGVPAKIIKYIAKQ